MNFIFSFIFQFMKTALIWIIKYIKPVGNKRYIFISVIINKYKEL
jgi:hypothetical protein